MSETLDIIFDIGTFAITILLVVILMTEKD